MKSWWMSQPIHSWPCDLWPGATTLRLINRDLAQPTSIIPPHYTPVHHRRRPYHSKLSLLIATHHRADVLNITTNPHHGPQNHNPKSRLRSLQNRPRRTHLLHPRVRPTGRMHLPSRNQARRLPRQSSNLPILIPIPALVQLTYLRKQAAKSCSWHPSSAPSAWWNRSGRRICNACDPRASKTASRAKRTGRLWRSKKNCLRSRWPWALRFWIAWFGCVRCTWCVTVLLPPSTFNRIIDRSCWLLCLSHIQPKRMLEFSVENGAPPQVRKPPFPAFTPIPLLHPISLTPRSPNTINPVNHHIPPNLHLPQPWHQPPGPTRRNRQTESPPRSHAQPIRAAQPPMRQSQPFARGDARGGPWLSGADGGVAGEGACVGEGACMGGSGVAGGEGVVCYGCFAVGKRWGGGRAGGGGGYVCVRVEVGKGEKLYRGVPGEFLNEGLRGRCSFFVQMSYSADRSCCGNRNGEAR